MTRETADRVRAAFFLAVIVAVIVLAVATWPELRPALESLRTLGRWAAPALVAAQIVQVVIFVIPGELVQITAGYLFGVGAGAALSMLGIAIGSVVNYLIGRTLGASFLTVVISKRQRARIERILDDRGVQLGMYILFFVPGLPKDVLGYLIGVLAANSGTREERRVYSLGYFVVLSMLGRMFGIVGSAAIGASAAAGYRAVAISLLVLAALTAVTAILFQRQIESFAARVAERVGRLFSKTR